MDLTSVKAAIESALRVAERLKSNAEEARRSGRDVEPSWPSKDFPDLLACLAAQPEMQKPGGHVLGPAGGGANLIPEMVGQMLLNFATERGADQAIEWLIKILATKRADVRLVTDVRGIGAPVEGLQLGDVKFIPWLNQPDTPTFRMWTRAAGDRFGLLPPPTAAILMLPDVQVGGTAVELATPGRQEHRERAKATVVRAMLSLTAVLDHPWSLGRSWFDFVDPDLQAAQLGVTYSAAIRDAPDPFGATELTDEHVAFGTRYLALDGAFARKLDIASARLNLARRRLWPGEKAVEASIALEALLGDGRSDTSYKLRLRAGLLVGGDVASRLDVMNTIKGFYDLRSKIVHGTEDATLPRAGANVTRSLEICAEVLKRLVEHGRDPDWPAFEVSGGRHPA